MIEAETLGCDTPTQYMIAEAINDAEDDVHKSIEGTLRQLGMTDAADAVARWVKRKHDA